ncbi:AraC family transcriptional regulator [Paenibacillus sp. LHD-117]|uniref:helix-turn-helix transcriptional regulator n=1 Tax=Paenibacillus sp. LHD-117 TaxID=3071412 RepID=UPI0027DFBA2A|nr:AraC family transcriptional regulator [Paenibacillus sp. LHD-117]MDQ6420389.1 AraC family transcriptional regulator [Paenibacillus sp. LHD-117]
MSPKHHIVPPFTMGTTISFNEQIQYHTHPHYEIYYFHGGKVNYLINDKIYVLEPGDLLLMHGMTLHKAHVDPNVAYHRTTIHLDPFYFKQHIQPAYTDDLLAPFRKLHNVRLQLRGEVKREAEESLAKLNELFAQGTPHAYQRFQARLLDLLIFVGELCTQPLQAMHSFPSSKEAHVQAIISYLENQYNDDITLEDIGERLHLSKFYLAKTFKQVTGMTIFQYLMHRRVYQAKLRLIEEGSSITMIGYDVGFKHPSHFSRAFKEHTGMTPEQYRKKHQLMQTKP